MQLFEGAAMTPVEYEHELARHFQQMGYLVQTTPLSNDGGVDMFATRGNSRIAVQAKMYGRGRRPVNRATIFELHGAAEFFGCDAAVLATNGRCLANAEEAAAKLGIELFHFDPTHPASAKAIPVVSQPLPSPSAPASDRAAFDHFWKIHVLPLKGQSIEYQPGKANRVVDVDWAGLTRISSRNGPPQTIGIEIFRSAFGELMYKGQVTRDWIDAEYVSRGSSIIIRVLAKAPNVELLHKPLRIVQSSK